MQRHPLVAEAAEAGVNIGGHAACSCGSSLGTYCKCCSKADADRALVAVARLLEGRIAEVSRARLVQEAQTQTGHKQPLTAGDFDEALFMESQQKRCPVRSVNDFCKFVTLKCRLLSRKNRGNFSTSPVPEEDILKFLRVVAKASSDFQVEVVVVSTIYIERLLELHPLVRLTELNWRSVVLAAMHLAIKTWEDVHPWNAELCRYLQRTLGLDIPTNRLHVLELRFLVGLDYRVGVSAELYAAYLFALRDADRPATPQLNPRGSWKARSDPDLVSFSLVESQVSTPNTTPPPRRLHQSRRLSIESREARAKPAPVPRIGRLLKGFLRQQSAPSELFQSNAEIQVPQQQGSKPLPQHDHGDLSARSVSTAASSGRAAEAGSPTGSSWASEEDATNLVRPSRPQLDPRNPHVGFLRHAPRAAPPSEYIAGRRPPETQTTPPLRRLVSPLAARVVTPRRRQ